MSFQELAFAKLIFKFTAFRQLKTVSKCCKCSSCEALYIIILSWYVKQKSKPDNTYDRRWQNTPGKEQNPNGATFQCHILLVVAKAVFSLLWM